MKEAFHNISLHFKFMLIEGVGELEDDWKMVVNIQCVNWIIF